MGLDDDRVAQLRETVAAALRSIAEHPEWDRSRRDDDCRS